MDLPSSNSRVMLVALTTPDAEGTITYHFNIDGYSRDFDARLLDQGGIQAIEMSEPLERLLQQMLPVFPNLVKTLVEVTLQVVSGEDGGLPLEWWNAPKA